METSSLNSARRLQHCMPNRRVWSSRAAWQYACLSALLLAFLRPVWCNAVAPKDTVSLTTSGGVTISPGGGTYKANMGSGNALGVGSSSAGVTAFADSMSPSRGTFYATSLRVTVSEMNNSNRRANIYTYISSDFVNTDSLAVYACASGGSCSQSAEYVAPGAAAPGFQVASNVQDDDSAVFSYAVLVKDGGMFHGSDGVSMKVRSVDTTNGDIGECTLNISISVQGALRLTLSGTEVGAGTTTDFMIDFGDVNALGIGAGGGISTSCASDTQCRYSTQYAILPEFAGLGSRNASVKLQRTRNFTHSSVLQLLDSEDGSTFTNITTAAIPIQVTSGFLKTRYLGLLVNGDGGAAGPDSARVTYTLSSP